MRGRNTIPVGRALLHQATDESFVRDQELRCAKEGLCMMEDAIGSCTYCKGQEDKERANAILIPILQKGNLNLCDIWRGISRLDVVEEVVGRIVQMRLQRRQAEQELPEFQCGFHDGLAFPKMIFTVFPAILISASPRSSTAICGADRTWSQTVPPLH